MLDYYVKTKITGIFTGYGEGRYIGVGSLGAVGEGLMVINEPAPFDALIVSCTSVQSKTFSLASPGLYGAIPLIEAFGSGDVSAVAMYKIFDDKMRLIGEVEQRSNFKISDDMTKVEGITSLDGSCWDDRCKGAIVKISPGYAIYYRQLDEETIEGIYGQILHTTHGMFYNIARRVYSKKNMRRSLPFDEILVYKILRLERTINNGKHVVKWSKQSYYIPARL